MNFEAIKAQLGEQFSHWADFLKKVVEELALPVSAKILDVGTGRGVMAIILAHLGYTVLTGEPADDHFADWQSAVKKVNLTKKITFQPFEAETLPFESDNFDAIFLFASLHHISDRTAAIREFFRCLKPTGKLVIFEQTPAGVNFIRQRRPKHPDSIDVMQAFTDVPENFRIVKHPEIKAYIFEK